MKRRADFVLALACCGCAASGATALSNKDAGPEVGSDAGQGATGDGGSSVCPETLAQYCCASGGGAKPCPTPWQYASVCNILGVGSELYTCPGFNIMAGSGPFPTFVYSQDSGALVGVYGIYGFSNTSCTAGPQELDLTSCWSHISPAGSCEPAAAVDASAPWWQPGYQQQVLCPAPAPAPYFPEGADAAGD
jgi:hypothetical protein